jgi:CubicO group peptidase (beta-lactamase class C family)
MQLLQKIVVAALALIFALPAQAQEPPLVEQIDQFVTEQMDAQSIPGLALAVIQDGEVLLARGYGLADTADEIPVTAETLFETASLAKPLFAVGLLRLVEQGLIDLDAPISDYIEAAPPTWSGITVRHLFTHTSGLPYSVDVPAACGEVYDDETLIQSAADVPLNAEPGARWEYSDLGYQLLAIIVERVSGQPRAAYLAEQVFVPAGMDTAQITHERPENEAVGYTNTRDSVQPSTRCDADQPLFPGGGLYLSLNDYIAWDMALRDGTLLSPAILEAMWTPGTLNDGSTVPYGLGWTVRDLSGQPVVEHGGGSDFVSHRFVRYLDAGVSVIVLSNLYLARVWDIAYGVAALVDPGLGEDADTLPLVEDAAPEITALLRGLLDDMAAGKLERDQLAPELQGYYEDFLALGSDLQAIGAPTGFLLLEQGEEDGLRTYRYRVDFGSVSAFIDLALNVDNQLADFNVGV